MPWESLSDWPGCLKPDGVAKPGWYKTQKESGGVAKPELYKTQKESDGLAKARWFTTTVLQTKNALLLSLNLIAFLLLGRLRIPSRAFFICRKKSLKARDGLSPRRADTQVRMPSLRPLLWAALGQTLLSRAFFICRKRLKKESERTRKRMHSSGGPDL